MAKPIVPTAVKETVYDGIICPNPACLAPAESYAGKQNKKTQDCITREKECKWCGTIFKTVEVPVGIKEIKNLQTIASAPAVATAPAPIPAVAIAPLTAPAASTTPVMPMASAPLAQPGPMV